MYKPDDYPDVSPYLIVSDAQAVLDFAARVFGAEPLRVHRGEDGEIRHAEMRIGDSVIMLGQSGGGPGAHLHLYMAYPDDAFLRAVSAGAEPVEEISVREDGDRRGGFRDPGGTTWWVSRAGPSSG